MAEEVFRQSNFNSGELDPSLLGRRDLKPYASGLAKFENMWAMPQGPARRRGGLVHCAMIRNRLEAVETDGATVTAANGGTAADLTNGTGFASVTGLSTTDGYVIAELDFGAPVTVGMVDLTDFAFIAAGEEPSPPGGGWSWWKLEEAAP